MDRARAYNALSIAGRDVRMTCKRYYGSPQAAEKAIREAAEDVEALESWAAMVTAKSIEMTDEVTAKLNDTVFRFDSLSPSMREEAKISMAVAMLAWTVEREEEVA